MTELFDAIQSALVAAHLDSTIAGGVHLQHVPDGTVTPYLVFNLVTSPTDPDYGSKEAYDATIRFTLIGKPPRVSLALMESVVTALNSAGCLTLTGGKVNHNVLHEDGIYELPSDMDRDDAAERLYGWYTDYVYSVR